MAIWKKGYRPFVYSQYGNDIEEFAKEVKPPVLGEAIEEIPRARTQPKEGESPEIVVWGGIVKLNSSRLLCSLHFLPFSPVHQFPQIVSGHGFSGNELFRGLQEDGFKFGEKFPNPDGLRINEASDFLVDFAGGFFGILVTNRDFLCLQKSRLGFVIQRHRA